MPSYTIFANNIANAQSKNMLAISNAAASGKLIKIYRVWITNPTTGTVSGGMTGFLLGRCNAIHSGGTATNFLPHSSCVSAGAATPFTGISAATGATTITATMATEFRRVFKASDELTASSGTLDEIENLLPWAVVWDTGYADTNVEPFVIRGGQCFLIRTDASPSNAVGGFTFHVELTIV